MPHSPGVSRRGIAFAHLFNSSKPHQDVGGLGASSFETHRFRDAPQDEVWDFQDDV
jgi:hypothetical protein